MDGKGKEKEGGGGMTRGHRKIHTPSQESILGQYSYRIDEEYANYGGAKMSVICDARIWIRGMTKGKIEEQRGGITIDEVSEYEKHGRRC